MHTFKRNRVVLTEISCVFRLPADRGRHLDTTDSVIHTCKLEKGIAFIAQHLIHYSVTAQFVEYKLDLADI